MRHVVEKAVDVMREAEDFLRRLGMTAGTAPDVAFTCGLKTGRLECARMALRDHEERSERARAAAKKARTA